MMESKILMVKYGTYEIFDTFRLLVLMGIKI
jgi:hypothetical protein